MLTKAIKVSEENYKWLCELAGELQVKEQKMVSVNEALDAVREKSAGKLSDLAGAWKTMSEREVNDFKRDLRVGWKKWTKSA